MSKRIVAGLLIATVAVIALLMRSTGGRVGADVGEDDAGAREVVDEIVAKIQADDMPGVMGVMKRNFHTTVPGEMEKTFDIIIAKRAEAANVIGNPLGEVEFIRKERAGKSLVRYIYLERHQRSGYVWGFNLYKGNAGWGLSKFTYSDRIYQALPPSSLPQD
jgi:hypothetical protein